MSEDYRLGFDAAVAKCRLAVAAVPVETWPDHNPFSQTPQTPNERAGRDVRADCAAAVDRVHP